MANGRDTQEIKRVRHEVLVALRIIYPGALRSDMLMRSLLVLFPALEFEQVKRDLHYLCEKQYLERIEPESETNGGFTPWRQRWFRLTAKGVEVVDRCVHDPAIEE